MNEYIISTDAAGNAEIVTPTGVSNPEWTPEAQFEDVDGMVVEFYVYAENEAEARKLAEAGWQNMMYEQADYSDVPF